MKLYYLKQLCRQIWRSLILVKNSANFAFRKLNILQTESSDFANRCFFLQSRNRFLHLTGSQFCLKFRRIANSVKLVLGPARSLLDNDAFISGSWWRNCKPRMPTNRHISGSKHLHFSLLFLHKCSDLMS